MKATVTKSASELVAGDHLRAMRIGATDLTSAVDLVVLETQNVAVVGQGEMVRLVFGPSSESTVPRSQEFEVDAVVVGKSDLGWEVMYTSNGYQFRSLGQFKTREAAEFMAQSVRDAMALDATLTKGG